MTLARWSKIFRTFLLVATLFTLAFYVMVGPKLTVVNTLHHMSLKFIPRNVDATSPPNVIPSPTFSDRYTILTRGNFIRPGRRDIAIVTAVFYKDVPAKNGFNVFLNGWARYKSPMGFVCCFLNQINETSTELVETKASLYHRYDQWKVDMQNGEFMCSITEKQLKSLSIRGYIGNTTTTTTTDNNNNNVNNHISSSKAQYVTFAENSCLDAPSKALRIEYRRTIPKSVGICLKISYGSLNPELVVEWFEYQRLAGVTKVFTFVAEDLDERARKVFAYYESIGFLETNPIHPAPKLINGTHRGFRRPRWEQQAWVDEVVAINDCKHRMAGLDFVIVHDMDELIVPKLPEDNIYTILKKMLNRQPKAAAFSFDAHVAMLDWGPTRLSPLHIMRTTNLSTTPNLDGADRNTRWAFMSDRIFFAQNNKAWPKKKYTVAKVTQDLFTLIHRRSCKVKWVDCNSTSIRRPDTTLVRYEKQLVENVRKVPLLSILGKKSRGYITGLMPED